MFLYKIRYSEKPLKGYIKGYDKDQFYSFKTIVLRHQCEKWDAGR